MNLSFVENGSTRWSNSILWKSRFVIKLGPVSNYYWICGLYCQSSMYLFPLLQIGIRTYKIHKYYTWTIYDDRVCQISQKKRRIKYMYSILDRHLNQIQLLSTYPNTWIIIVKKETEKEGEAIANGFWYKIQNRKCKFTYFFIHFRISSSFFHWNSIQTKQKGTTYFWFYMWYLQVNLHIYSLQSSTKCYYSHKM